MRPAAQLRDQLADRRASGADFDDAWSASLTAALGAVDIDERDDWRRALDATRGAWQDAYEQLPIRRRERALALIADGSDREPMPDRVCLHCGADIWDVAGTPGRRRVYCSARCRKAHHNQLLQRHRQDRRRTVLAAV